MELHAHAVDGVDLLGMLASLTPSDLIAVRKVAHDRIDLDTRAE